MAHDSLRYACGALFTKKYRSQFLMQSTGVIECKMKEKYHE